MSKSYVYFGHCCWGGPKEVSTFKIGETGNLKQRKSALYSKDAVYVTDSWEVKGFGAERLFIESYLRMRILTCGKATLHVFTHDYFDCETKYLNWFVNQIDLWISEAENIIEKMK